MKPLQWISLFLSLGLLVAACVPTQVSSVPKVELNDGDVWALEVQDPNSPQASYELRILTKPGSTIRLGSRPTSSYQAKWASAGNREGRVIFVDEGLSLFVDLDPNRSIACDAKWDGSTWTGKSRLGSNSQQYTGTCKASKK